MKLLFEYTLDYVKRNRLGSLAIMIAILMTSTMLSSLCGFLYNMYVDNLNSILLDTGDWHGELFDKTPGSALTVINSFDSIDVIMIKDDWKVSKIDDPRRDYIVWREANADYWKVMPEGNTAILEGRAPSAANEVALSKQYFEHHPELQMGDIITLPLGNRIASHGSIIEPVEKKQPGESFSQSSTVTLTVVGKLDATTSSTTPAYYALGYMEVENIDPKDQLTIYFKFKNIHNTYKELPRIAAAVGYQPNEYGEYMLRYNTAYLSRKAVFSPKQLDAMTLLLANQMPIAFGIIGLLVAGLFVLIIHNAFALSAGARLSQLGILAGIGATPRQIKRSVVLEAMLLTVIPLPLGLLLGQLPVKLLLDFFNKNAMPAYDRSPINFTLGWQSLLPAVVLSLLTVWWSALIPARRVSKLSPIDAIRQGEVEKLGKPRRVSIGKLFGLPGELAGNALHARKKSYRTATISLTLSFLTLTTFLCSNSLGTASNAVYKRSEKKWENQDILVWLQNVTTQEDYELVTQKIGSLEGVARVSWSNELRAAAWLSPEVFSADFLTAGGFEAAYKKLLSDRPPLLRDGAYRVYALIVGLDDKTFSDYCATLGIDPALFYKSDRWRSIFYNTIEDVTTSTKRRPISIPYLNMVPGDTLTLTEKTMDNYPGDFFFETELTAIADRLPQIGEGDYGWKYDILQFMPMSRVKELAPNFARSRMESMYGVVCVSSPDDITSVRNAIEEVCGSYFGSGDFDLYDENEFYALEAAEQIALVTSFGFIAGLLAIIGLSNVWSTVRGTLNARRREFAMLRSVGLPPKGLRQMLTLEALLLGVTPILISLPIVVVIQWVLLLLSQISFIEWLPYVPWQPVLLYAVAVLSVTVAAYALGGKALNNENIIDAIRLDTI